MRLNKYMNLKVNFFGLVTPACLLAISSSTWAGGLTGGGGGVVIFDPIPKEEVIKLLNTGLPDVVLLFNMISNSKDQEVIDSKLFEKLFAGRETVFEAIRKMQLDQKMDGPCTDHDGKETDGSAPWQTPYGICISIKNLSEKLTEENYRAQTLALLAHEVSHLVKSTEEQAKELQTYVLRQLLKTNAGQASEQLAMGAGQFNGIQSIMQDGLIASLESGNVGLICQTMTILDDGFQWARRMQFEFSTMFNPRSRGGRDSNRNSQAAPYHLLPAAIWSEFEASETNLMEVTGSLCGLDAENPSVTPEHMKKAKEAIATFTKVCDYLKWETSLSGGASN